MLDVITLNSNVNHLMERAGMLIERLAEQYRNNASVNKLMITAQLLIAELRNEERNAQQSPEQKVSVFFPSFSHFNETETELQLAEEKQYEDIGAQKKYQPAEAEPEVSPNAHRQPYFDRVMEIPTLALKQQEVNETMGRSESLND